MPLSDSMIMLQLEAKSTTFNLIQIYAQTHASDEEEIEQSYTNL